jgi:membrane protease subunit HflC
MNRFLVPIAIVVAAVMGLVALNSLFVVRQTQYALVLWFGEARRVVLKPGLYAKVPVAEQVVTIDRQLLPVEIPQQKILASDRKQLVVDAFARYRITDPVKYFRAYGSETVAQSRLEGYLSSAVRNQVAAQNFAAVLSEKRGALMVAIREAVNAQVLPDGVQLVDVRIRRADLPEENSKSIYERMRTERQQEAAGFRAEGEQKSLEIKARADREVTIIRADAQKEAEILRGQGDAERNRTYAEAYGQDPEFFAFYRSMRAYDEGLSKDNSTLILGTDGEFFRYLNAPEGSKR